MPVAKQITPTNHARAQPAMNFIGRTYPRAAEQQDAADKRRAIGALRAPSSMRRLQLILVLGRPTKPGRSVLFVLAMVSGGCDRMISDRFPLPPPAAEWSGGVTDVAKVTGLARETLIGCGARPQDISVRRSSVTWDNPDKAPGLTVQVSADAVRLSQHLYGSVNATATYRCVRRVLPERLSLVHAPAQARGKR